MRDQAETRTALAALAMDPGRAGLVLDFDGVLAPIMADPATCAMPDRVARSLARLAGARIMISPNRRTILKSVLVKDALPVLDTR